tara:strand:- start:62 stop:262 length:201 start_codon:yes stop_codon:yes gene_type:complete
MAIGSVRAGGLQLSSAKGHSNRLAKQRLRALLTSSCQIMLHDATDGWFEEENSLAMISPTSGSLGP